MNAFLCNLLRMALNFVEYEQRFEPVVELDLEIIASLDNVYKGVDITSISWIKDKKRELDGLTGILVAHDWNGYFESFEFFARTHTSVTGIDERLNVFLFEELQTFFHSEPEEFDLRIKFDDVDCFKGKFLRFAALDKDIELVKYLRKSSHTNIEMDDEEALKEFGQYFQTCPERFFDFFLPEKFELFFKIGFNESQLRAIAINSQDQVIELIRNVCCHSASSYLLRPEIKQQVLLIYHSLSSNAKLSVQLVLYFRDILTAEEIDLNNLWMQESDIISVLLGPRKVLTLLQRSRVGLFTLVNKAAEIDPSVYDWFVENVTEYNYSNEEIDVFAESRPAKIPIQFFQIEKQIQICERVICEPLPIQLAAEGEKKAFAHRFDSQNNFLRSLQICPFDSLVLFVKPLSKYGSAAELEMFCERSSEELINYLFYLFWKSHLVMDHFCGCALVVFDRISRFSKDLLVKAPFSSKFLDNPVLFERVQSLGIDLCFDFDSIVEAVQNDVIFERMLPYRYFFVRSLQLSEYSFKLRLTGKPLTRLLELINMNLHQFLQLYWTANKKVCINFDLKYCCSVFLILKRWKSEHPKEVANVLVSRPPRQTIEELVKGASVLRSFDNDSLELIRTHLLLGQSIQNRV